MTQEEAEFGRLIAGTLLMVLVAMAFRAGIMMLWMKEKYELWTQEEINQKMRTNE